MINFFIALFGGLFYGGKYISERSKDKAYDMNMQLYDKRFDKLKSQITVYDDVAIPLKEYILSGEHFDEICEEFAADFEFVLGEDWKSKLQIPPNPLRLDPRNRDAYSFSIPANHLTWVFRLMLASQGKMYIIDLMGHSLSIGGFRDEEICLKFAQRIEMHMQKYIPEFRFVVPDTGDRCTDRYLAIESLCNKPYYRLW